MRGLILVTGLCVLAAAPAGAQSHIPETALLAEGEGRWPDALRIYRAELDRDPHAVDLWVRVADIEARLGRPAEAIAALEAASAAAPGQAALHARLSQAYAASGHATAALRAIEAALGLEPASTSHLLAHARLATWAGEYRDAAASYRSLLVMYPADGSVLLGLARVYLWSGQANAAAATYRAYLSSSSPEADAWLELARAESWRGNTAGALGALRHYHERHGETTVWRRELAASLARGGRPRAALRHLDVLTADCALAGLKACATTGSADDYDLQLARTVAFASVRRHGAAAASLRDVDTLRPGHADTRAAESLLRSILGSSVGPATTVYNDSDGLQTVRVAPRFDLGFRSDTRLQGGYEHLELRARTGSGLDQLSGIGTATVMHVYAGLSQRLGPLTIGGTVGHARPETADLTTYSARLRVAPADTFAAGIERTSGAFAISPRTVGLGLTRLGHRGQIDWSPSLRSHLALEGAYEELSDGNARWEAFVSPRVAIARTQHINLDVGLLLHQFGATHDFDHGYYDPRRYEYYSFVVTPYWKASENIGFGFSAGLGGQRDDRARAFRPGGNASVEASFGIYSTWLLKVHGAATSNRRLDSGAFNGYSGGVVLLRRF
jgi:tetratricopeptide (TPR) repeat protein